MKSQNVVIEMKATGSYWAVLCCGAVVYYDAQVGANF